MGLFGWSYPPGCNGTPYDEEYPCDVCGEFPDDCICPECPECGEVGDPTCYRVRGLRGWTAAHYHGKPDHGLVRTEAQKFNLECRERAWKEEAEAERR